MKWTRLTRGSRPSTTLGSPLEEPRPLPGGRDPLPFPCVGCGADQDGIGAQPSAHDPDLELRGLTVVPNRLPKDGKKVGETLDNPPTEDQSPGVVAIDEPHHSIGKVPLDLLDQSDRKGVSPPVGLEDRPGRDLLWGTDESSDEALPAPPTIDLETCPFPDGPATDVRLDASPMRAMAGGAAGDQGHMTDLPKGIGGTLEESPPDHRGRADTGSDHQAEPVVGAPSRPEPPFPEGRGPGIVDEIDRRVKLAGEVGGQGPTLPPQVRGIDDPPPARVDLGGDSHAHRPQRTRAGRLARPNAPDNLGDQFRVALIAVDSGTAMARHRPIRLDPTTDDLGGAQVDSNDSRSSTPAAAERRLNHPAGPGRRPIRQTCG